MTYMHLFIPDSRWFWHSCTAYILGFHDYSNYIWLIYPIKDELCDQRLFIVSKLYGLIFIWFFFLEKLKNVVIRVCLVDEIL